MSRILKVMVVLLAITAMVAPTVFAEDRLSLSGAMRVRGMFYNLDDGATESSHAWNDQRLRIGGKIAVAEGISVNFRFDATESDDDSSNAVAWGGTAGFKPATATTNASKYAPYTQRRGDIQFDKAYLQIVKNGYSLSAGQMYFGGFGTGALLDCVGTGFSLTKGGLTLHHIKQYDENQGNDGFAASNSSEDVTLTAAKYVVKTDTFTITPMASYTFEDSTDVNLLGLGVNGMFDLGAVALKGEMVYFNGEDAAANDRKGLQIYLDGSMAASDTVKVGLIGLYAQGQDGGDVQVTAQSMPIFAEWHPENYGYQSTEFATEFTTFDPSGAGAGVLGAIVYADVKASDDLAMKFSAGYLQTEDDGISDLDGFVLNAGASYAVATNTVFNTHVNYQDFDNNGTDEKNLGVISELAVKF